MSVVSTAPVSRPSRVSHTDSRPSRTRHRRALSWIFLLALWAAAMALLALAANSVVAFSL